jgi:plastocyanin
MMPGMGLTAIGLAGLTLSYAGIAHTFIDGMHALTGLTMFVGLIFLAAGILDGGVSTSNRAKATTLVILSISLGFGMYAMTMNTSNFTVTIAGILMGIAFPAIIIAYLAMKHPTIVKPIGSIVAMAAATGIIMWVSFGVFSAPDTYMIPQQVGIEEPEEDLVPAGPVFTIDILEGSDQEGEPDYEPDRAVIPQGHTIEWINVDAVAHTVTSAVDIGETFDSSLINAGESYTLDTTSMEAGEYEYLCILHTWMVATIVIEAPSEPTKVSIPEGTSVTGCEETNECYLPFEVSIDAGTLVSWSNDDTAAHTVTSGLKETGADGIFDSGLLPAGETFETAFNDPGSFDYYCVVHPWMTGIVNVS